MARNHSVFITIENQFQDYVECLKTIDMIKEHRLNDAVKGRVKVFKYKSNIIVPNKLEEPLDGDDINSSITVIEEKEWFNEQERYFMNSHIHIRVLYSNSDLSDYLKNLHYLSLLLCKQRQLISQKRLSAFLVPRTESKYPFSNGDKTDTELYSVASTRLRAFVGKENQGVIYGVARSVTADNKNVVKALDYKKIPLASDCFPVIYLQGKVSSAEKLVEKYFLLESSDKKKSDFNSDEIIELNLYSLLFHNGVIDNYLKEVCCLGKGRRFGYSNSSNPKLALVDYIFEVSAVCLRDKLSKNGIKLQNLTNSSQNMITPFVCKEIGKMNIFTFALFAFLFSFSESDSMKLDNILRDYIVLANEISNALNQIIQNSLQHSTEKICIISFFRKRFVNNEEQLKIIISDLGDKTILESFYNQLLSENKILKSLNKVLNIDFNDIVVSDEKMINSINSIELKHLFNDFTDCSLDNLYLWKDFRQNDSSAHIGLALFSQIMDRCCADYQVVSSNSYDCKTKNVYYVGSNVRDEASESIPGTEFNISIPIRKLASAASFSLSQLNNGKYRENYDCYADFLDFEQHPIKIPENLANVIAVLLKESRQALQMKTLDKFAQQLIFSRFWLNIFNTLGDTDLSKLILNLDFCKINFRKGFLENSDIHREVVVKGFMNAICLFSREHKGSNIYLAVTHLNKEMINTFHNVLLSLSIKNFPENLQLFLAEYDDCDSTNIQTHLVGSSYGETIQNAFVISIENGAESFELSTYLYVVRLCKPFMELVVSDTALDQISIAPFTMFITDSDDETNVFFKNVKTISENELIRGNGYKICNTHTRLGNKVHINSFYEMSFLFYRTIMANRVAFEIIRDMMKDGSDINIINDRILFYGYASYSQAILTSLSNIVKSYRAKKGSAADIYYAVYQYNLQSESNGDEIQVFLNDKNIGDVFVKIIQIVPISSTLTTFEKMWEKFTKTVTFPNYKLVRNYSVIWVRDDLYDESKKSTNIVPDNEQTSALARTAIEDNYYIPYKNNRIKTKFSQLKAKNCEDVHYIISTHSLWQIPEKCRDCYLDNIIDEKPLIETDPTSTVPAQQIALSLAFNSSDCYNEDEDNLQRLLKIKGNVYYGHYKRGKNHFQFYIDTINYFSKVQEDVKIWLNGIADNHRKSADVFNLPYQNVIFSPEHNTNVGFSQYVNAYYFNGTAEIISLNEDKEFRSNFICEHAALKNTIERLFLSLGNISDKKYLPVKFYFVDDNIITGTTLHKASSLLQSLIPKEYIHLYSTTVFEKCFFLIDRLSDSSKISYVIPTDNFISFCHINISNTRKHGDSCVGCKIYNQARKFVAHSATNYMSDYWSGRVYDYELKSFETLQTQGDDKSYYMLSLSHTLKELFSLNQAGDCQTFYVMITEFFKYLSDKSSSTNLRYGSFLEQHSVLWNLVHFEKEQRKLMIECLIKIISRPFFTFNFTIKSQAMRFIISISERILYPNHNKQSLAAEDSIVSLYCENDKALRAFLEKTIFGALTDLQSTYLIRKRTIKGALQFINNYTDSKPFWRQYSIYVKKIVDGSADESRCFWLEHLLNTGFEITEKNVECNDKGRLYDVIVSELSNDNLKPDTKMNFHSFLEQLLIENGRILFDKEEYSFNKKKYSKMPAHHSDMDYMAGEKYYFAKRWDKFIKSDLLSICKQNAKEQPSNNNDNLLFDYLKRKAEVCQSHVNSSFGKDIIRVRYDSLLLETHKMICNKYQIEKENIRIAILTCSGEKQNLPRISDLDVVSEVIYNKNKRDNGISKYIIKERIVKALSDDSIKSSLMENGYYICASGDCSDDEYIQSQKDQNYTLSNHRKPYMILYFTISDNMIAANTKLKPIIPVYLYISMIDLDAKARKVMPAFIVRDILINKYALNQFFVADFTSDVLQRYAHTIGTEAILKNEKEISHSSLSNDRIQIEQIMNMGNEQSGLECVNKSPISKEKMLEWFTARNYCNMVTARLHNRVMRNFNKDLGMIISESENGNSVKLYVEAELNDGFSIPLNNLAEILPVSQTDDYIFKLFQQVITFEGIEELCRSRKPVVIKYNEKKYTYNRDFAKNLIYRVCFDALRFSRGAGAENDDFVKRIINHYTLLNVRKYAAGKKNDTESTRFQEILLHYSDVIPCRMNFSFENGTECFDWLVIKNELNVHQDHDKILDSIKKKLLDPLDFSDGHMSLIAHKEFLFKPFTNLEGNNIFLRMYSYGKEDGKEYFITRLPIIDKLGGS